MCVCMYVCGVCVCLCVCVCVCVCVFVYMCVFGVCMFMCIFLYVYAWETSAFGPMRYLDGHTNVLCSSEVLV